MRQSKKQPSGKMLLASSHDKENNTAAARRGKNIKVQDSVSITNSGNKKTQKMPSKAYEDEDYAEDDFEKVNEEGGKSLKKQVIPS